MTWVGQVALRNTVRYAPKANGFEANTVPTAVLEGNSSAQYLLAPQLQRLDSLAGPNSASAATGLFSPSARLASGAASGGGRLLGNGFVPSQGFVLGEGLVLSETRADMAAQADGSLLGK